MKFKLKKKLFKINSFKDLVTDVFMPETFLALDLDDTLIKTPEISPDIVKGIIAFYTRTEPRTPLERAAFEKVVETP